MRKFQPRALPVWWLLVYHSLFPSPTSLALACRKMWTSFSRHHVQCTCNANNWLLGSWEASLIKKRLAQLTLWIDGSVHRLHIAFLNCKPLPLSCLPCTPQICCCPQIPYTLMSQSQNSYRELLAPLYRHRNQSLPSNSAVYAAVHTRKSYRNCLPLSTDTATTFPLSCICERMKKCMAM